MKSSKVSWKSPAPSDLTFRLTLRDGEDKHIRTIAESVGIFHPAEVDVAEELATLSIEQGADQSGYHFVLCERVRQIVGYTCYGQIACTKDSYDLYWIVVQHDCRGQGIGRQLLQLTEQQIATEGGRKLYAETSSREPYAGTRQFYLANGYQQEAVIADFYDEGDHKLIYVKNISK